MKGKKLHKLYKILLSGACAFGISISACTDSTKSSFKYIDFAVPKTELYETTANELTVDEADKISGFYTYMGKYISDLPKDNPITIDGKVIEQIPTTNSNFYNLKGAEYFKSGFYNSRGHDLESMTGIFVSQGASFKNSNDAKFYREALLKDDSEYCAVLLEKGNTISAVNMYKKGASPTKELWELVDFAKSKGFNSFASDSCPAR